MASRCFARMPQARQAVVSAFGKEAKGRSVCQVDDDDICHRQREQMGTVQPYNAKGDRIEIPGTPVYPGPDAVNKLTMAAVKSTQASPTKSNAGVFCRPKKGEKKETRKKKKKKQKNWLTRARGGMGKRRKLSRMSVAPEMLPSKPQQVLDQPTRLSGRGCRVRESHRHVMYREAASCCATPTAAGWPTTRPGSAAETRPG
jgi:hypothetical protein